MEKWLDWSLLSYSARHRTESCAGAQEITSTRQAFSILYTTETREERGGRTATHNSSQWQPIRMEQPEWASIVLPRDDRMVYTFAPRSHGTID